MPEGSIAHALDWSWIELAGMSLLVGVLVFAISACLLHPKLQRSRAERRAERERQAQMPRVTVIREVK